MLRLPRDDQISAAAVAPGDVKMSHISEDRRHKLRDHSPAAKLVYVILEQHGRPLPITDIAERSLLPESTARSVLRDLEENGLVEKTTDVRDARKRCYRVLESEETAK